MEIVGLLAVLAYLANSAPVPQIKVPCWCVVVVLTAVRLYQVWR